MIVDIVPGIVLGDTKFDKAVLYGGAKMSATRPLPSQHTGPLQTAKAPDITPVQPLWCSAPACSYITPADVIDISDMLQLMGFHTTQRHLAPAIAALAESQANQPPPASVQNTKPEDSRPTRRPAQDKGHRSRSRDTAPSLQAISARMEAEDYKAFLDSFGPKQDVQTTCRHCNGPPHTDRSRAVRSRQCPAYYAKCDVCDNKGHYTRYHDTW